MLKVGIGIATAGTIKDKTLLSLSKIMINSPYNLTLIVKSGSIISENRTNIVRQAQRERCDYLLFVDSDMYFETDILKELMDSGKEIIGVDSKYKELPLKSTVRGELQDSLFKCDGVGTGLMLIKMSVFDIIDLPYFYIEMNDYGAVKTSEDYWFCNQAKKKGYDIWCDPQVKVKHIGEYLY